MRSSLPVVCLLVAAASAQHVAPARATPHMIRRSVKQVPRQAFDPFGGSGSDTGLDSGSGSDTTTSDAVTTPTSTSTTPTSTSTTPTSTSTSTSATPTTTSTSSSSTQPTTTSTSYRSTVTSSSQLTATTTNAAGSTIFTTQTLEPVSTSTAAVPTASQAADTSNSSGGHTGLIIGVSVVGGIALLGALIFLWMKFGGKRFSDYQDEDADIKWPELKTDGDSAAMQPLPARRTGGAGFDMGNEFDDHPDADHQSMAEYGNLGTESTTALNTEMGAGSAVGYGAGTYQSGMEGAYHDDSPSANNHYGQPVEAPYYDPYSNSAYPSAQPQTYYPEQGQHHDGALDNPHPSTQYEQYEDYNNYSADPYGAARAQAASTSPQMGPYRVNTQSSRHQGY